MKYVLLVCLLGCQLETEVAAKRPTTVPTARDTIVDSAIAMERYAKGQDAIDDETSRRYFRAECSYHQLDRETTLDMMHERAGIHSYAWQDFYQHHCKPMTGVMILPETGKTVDPYVCDADAGAPPAKQYERSDEEKLAQKQRDACERAQ